MKFNITKKGLLAVVTLLGVSLSLAPAALANTIIVSTSIQAAVDAAKPGDRIVVPVGTFHENVLISKDNLTILGAPNATLDGTGLIGATGIKVAPTSPGGRIKGFSISGMTIKNYKDVGIMLVAVDNFRITNGNYINNKEYGIYPVYSSNGLISFNKASGANDTGIYVGQSKNVEVSNNYATLNTSGFEVENSSNIRVRLNVGYNNAIGLAVFVLPRLTVKSTSNVQVTDNLFSNNNRPNPSTDPALSQVPSGVGILIMAADKVVVLRNSVIQNNTVGIAVIRLPEAFSIDPKVNPFPDQNRIVRNVVVQNGTKPDPKFPQYESVDLLWDTEGNQNCWSGNSFLTSFPALPACP